jgi:hypothetical protein
VSTANRRWRCLQLGEHVSAEIFAGRKSVRGGEPLPNAPGASPSASGIGNQKDTKQVLKSVMLFYGIACGFAWLAWTPLVLSPAGLKLHKHAVSFPISACIGTLGPFLACFISHRVQAGNWRAVRLMPRSRLQMIWHLLGPLLVLFWPLFRISRIHLKGKSKSMALACERPGRPMGANVQLQPSRWTTL